MSGTLKPVDGDSFAGLLGQLNPADKIAVAVSGGADSMALAFCAARWAEQKNKTIIAFIVDHGLRPESAQEAQQVKTRLQSMGITAEILCWQHQNAAAAMHEQSRAARYRLLGEACQHHGITDLMTAHHREDQAETILMRLSKGSGVEGLAGMSPISQRGNIRILRPFLTVSKQQLIATCDAAKIEYVIDPGNASEKYARGRLRKIMPLLETEGLTIDSLNDLGVRAAEASAALDFYTSTFLRDAAHTETGGVVRLDRASLGTVPRAIAMRALADCLRYVHCGDHPPERGALSSLLDALIDRQNDAARTFYGCIISLAPKDAIILREPSAATHAVSFQNGDTVLWDNRWQVGGAIDIAGDQALTLRALGNPPHETIDALAPALRQSVPQGRARATLPAVWQGENLRAIPSFDEKSAFRLIYRKQLFPSSDKKV